MQYYSTGFLIGKEASDISMKFSEKTDFKTLGILLKLSQQIVIPLFVKSCGSFFFMLS